MIVCRDLEEALEMGFNARLSRHELSGVVIVCRDLEEALEMGFNARLSRHELSGVRLQRSGGGSRDGV